jgi:hypothetical protein
LKGLGSTNFAGIMRSGQMRDVDYAPVEPALSKSSPQARSSRRKHIAQGWRRRSTLISEGALDASMILVQTATNDGSQGGPMVDHKKLARLRQLITEGLRVQLGNEAITYINAVFSQLSGSKRADFAS